MEHPQARRPSAYALRPPGARGAGTAAADPDGVRQFHGCYSVGEDRLWGVVRRRKSTGNTLAALKSIRAARPTAHRSTSSSTTCPHKGTKIRAWAARNNVELCYPPPTRPGPTRSKPSSDRSARSSSPDPTTPATPSSPGNCTPTCAGATPTPATPTSWPPNDANAPASAANDNTGRSPTWKAPGPERRLSATPTRPRPTAVLS